MSAYSSRSNANTEIGGLGMDEGSITFTSDLAIEDQIDSNDEDKIELLVNDQQIAARAVKMVIQKSRDSIVPLCTGVADLMRQNTRLQARLEKLESENRRLRSASTPSLARSVAVTAAYAMAESHTFDRRVAAADSLVEAKNNTMPKKLGVQLVSRQPNNVRQFTVQMENYNQNLPTESVAGVHQANDVSKLSPDGKDKERQVLRTVRRQESVNSSDMSADQSSLTQSPPQTPRRFHSLKLVNNRRPQISNSSGIRSRMSRQNSSFRSAHSTVLGSSVHSAKVTNSTGTAGSGIVGGTANLARSHSLSANSTKSEIISRSRVKTRTYKRPKRSTSDPLEPELAKQQVIDRGAIRASSGSIGAVTSSSVSRVPPSAAVANAAQLVGRNQGKVAGTAFLANPPYHPLKRTTSAHSEEMLGLTGISLTEIETWEERTRGESQMQLQRLRSDASGGSMRHSPSGLSQHLERTITTDTLDSNQSIRQAFRDSSLSGAGDFREERDVQIQCDLGGAGEHVLAPAVVDINSRLADELGETKKELESMRQRMEEYEKLLRQTGSGAGAKGDVESDRGDKSQEAAAVRTVTINVVPASGSSKGAPLQQSKRKAKKAQKGSKGSTTHESASQAFAHRDSLAQVHMHVPIEVSLPLQHAPNVANPAHHSKTMSLDRRQLNGSVKLKRTDSSVSGDSIRSKDKKKKGPLSFLSNFFKKLTGKKDKKVRKASSEMNLSIVSESRELMGSSGRSGMARALQRNESVTDVAVWEPDPDTIWYPNELAASGRRLAVGASAPDINAAGLSQISHALPPAKQQFRWSVDHIIPEEEEVVIKETIGDDVQVTLRQPGPDAEFGSSTIYCRPLSAVQEETDEAKSISTQQQSTEQLQMRNGSLEEVNLRRKISGNSSVSAEQLNMSAGSNSLKKLFQGGMAQAGGGSGPLSGKSRPLKKAMNRPLSLNIDEKSRKTGDVTTGEAPIIQRSLPDISIEAATASDSLAKQDTVPSTPQMQMLREDDEDVDQSHDHDSATSLPHIIPTPTAAVPETPKPAAVPMINKVEQLRNRFENRQSVSHIISRSARTSRRRKSRTRRRLPQRVSSSLVSDSALSETKEKKDAPKVEPSEVEETKESGAVETSSVNSATTTATATATTTAGTTATTAAPVLATSSPPTAPTTATTDSKQAGKGVELRPTATSFRILTTSNQGPIYRSTLYVIPEKWSNKTGGPTSLMSDAPAQVAFTRNTHRHSHSSYDLRGAASDRLSGLPPDQADWDNNRLSLDLSAVRTPSGPLEQDSHSKVWHWLQSIERIDNAATDLLLETRARRNLPSRTSADGFQAGDDDSSSSYLYERHSINCPSRRQNSWTGLRRQLHAASFDQKSPVAPFTSTETLTDYSVPEAVFPYKRIKAQHIPPLIKTWSQPVDPRAADTTMSRVQEYNIKANPTRNLESSPEMPTKSEASQSLKPSKRIKGLHGCKCAICLFKATVTVTRRFDVTIGDYAVIPRKRYGFVRYIGHLDRSPHPQHVYAGIELLLDGGECDGTYKGKSYFRCSGKSGIFIPIYQVFRAPGERHIKPSAN